MTSAATAALTNTANTAATSASTTSTSKAAASGKSLAQNFDTFLTMLTTQLKHQDPLSPMDSTQFTNQLVQFAAVEQQINANSNLEKLISSTALNTKSQAINYIGHSIEADTTSLPLQGGAESQTNVITLQGGVSAFAYSLPSAADKVLVQVKDTNGNVIRTMGGDTANGKHSMTWDGMKADGTQANDGTYTINVIATTKSGSEIAATTYAQTSAGKGSYSYTLGEEAKSVVLTIKDASGKVVRTMNGETSAGRHEASWDGKDNNGMPMKDGQYSVGVAAVNAEGETLDAAITVYGKVTDVAADDNGVLISMNGAVVSLDKVLTVRDTASLTN